MELPQRRWREAKRAQRHHLSRSTLQIVAGVTAVIKQWIPKRRLVGMICWRIKNSFEWNRTGMGAWLCSWHSCLALSKLSSLSEPPFPSYKIEMVTISSSSDLLWGLQNNACNPFMIAASIITINRNFRVELNLNICCNRYPPVLLSPTGAGGRECRCIWPHLLNLAVF